MGTLARVKTPRFRPFISWLRWIWWLVGDSRPVVCSRCRQKVLHTFTQNLKIFPTKFQPLWSWPRMLLSLSVLFAVSLTVLLASNVSTGYVPLLVLNALIYIISPCETRVLWTDSSSDSNCSWVSSSPPLDASASLLNDSSLMSLYLDASSLL